MDLIDIATYAFFVAENGGTVVGTTGLIVEGRAGRLVRVAVAPAHRRNGIAAALLSYADEHARRSGLVELLAHTQPSGPMR